MREFDERDHRDPAEVRLYYSAVDNEPTSREPSAGKQLDEKFDARTPQLSRWRRMQIPVIAGAVYWAVRLVGPTLRLEVVGVHNAIQIRNTGEPGIGAFWHRCIFPAVWIWRNRGIVVLNTVHFDGQRHRRVVERLGFGTVQGSSTRGGISGITEMAKCIEEGRHVAFTIDGPRGPRFVAKPGPVILARRTGRQVSVFHIGLKWAITFKKAWDLFQLPIPFTRAVMFIAPPICVPSDAGSEQMKQKQDEMQAALERVRDLAESWFRLSEKERDRLRDEWRERSCSTESAETVSSPASSADG